MLVDDIHIFVYNKIPQEFLLCVWKKISRFGWHKSFQNCSQKRVCTVRAIDRKSIEIQSNFDALVLFGILYVSTNRGPLATKRCNQMIKQYPDSPGPYQALSMIIRVTEHIRLRIRHFTSLMESTTEKDKPMFLYVWRN